MGSTLRDDILAVCVEEAVKLLPRLRTEFPESVYGTWKLEFVVGRLAGVSGATALDVLKTLSVAVPNEAHMLLALHLMRGALQVTLNFDRGVEIAYGLLTGAILLPATAASFEAPLAAWRDHVPPSPKRLRVVVADSDFDALPRQEDGPTLVKLHGSLTEHEGGLIVSSAVVTDEVEMARLSDSRMQAIDRLTLLPEVFITGYSGFDIDVYQPLIAHLRGKRFQWTSPTWASAPALHDAVLLAGGEPQTGLAAGELRRILRAERLPPWPEEPLPVPSYRDRFAEWAERARRLPHGTRALALAWMLADAGQFDLSIELLRRVVSERRPDAATMNRLADCLYLRNEPGDRIEARRLWLRLTVRRDARGYLRSYALTRWGGSYRSGLQGGPARRAVAALRALAGTLGGVGFARLDGDIQAEARAVAEVAHLALRIAESGGRPQDTMANALLKAVVATGIRATGRALSLTPTGLPGAFIRQQQAELEVFSAMLSSRHVDDRWRRQLTDLRDAYLHADNWLGLANATAALALVAIADGDGQRAHSLLDEAESGYRRPDGSGIDPSGAALVERRRRLAGTL